MGFGTDSGRFSPRRGKYSRVGIDIDIDIDIDIAGAGPTGARMKSGTPTAGRRDRGPAVSPTTAAAPVVSLPAIGPASAERKIPD
jgi:hypothetical protein